MKVIKVGILSREEMQEYTKKIAKGEIKVGNDEPKIFFESEAALRGRSFISEAFLRSNLLDSGFVLDKSTDSYYHSLDEDGKRCCVSVEVIEGEDNTLPYYVELNKLGIFIVSAVDSIQTLWEFNNFLNENGDKVEEV